MIAKKNQQKFTSQVCIWPHKMLLKAFHGDVDLVDDREVVTLEDLELNKGQLSSCDDMTLL